MPLADMESPRQRIEEAGLKASLALIDEFIFLSSHEPEVEYDASLLLYGSDPSMMAVHLCMTPKSLLRFTFYSNKRMGTREVAEELADNVYAANCIELVQRDGTFLAMLHCDDDCEDCDEDTHCPLLTTLCNHPAVLTVLLQCGVFVQLRFENALVRGSLQKREAWTWDEGNMKKDAQDAQQQLLRHMLVHIKHL